MEKLPGFVKLSAAAKAKIEPAERALAEARKKHRQDAEEISAALPSTDLFKVMQEIERHLEKVAQRGWWLKNFWCLLDPFQGSGAQALGPFDCGEGTVS